MFPSFSKKSVMVAQETLVHMCKIRSMHVLLPHMPKLKGLVCGLNRQDADKPPVLEPAVKHSLFARNVVGSRRFELPT
jgi:hypothetical protein